MLDVVIFLLTLWKSLQSGISSHTSLINVFLRDGESPLPYLFHYADAFIPGKHQVLCTLGV